MDWFFEKKMHCLTLLTCCRSRRTWLTWILRSWPDPELDPGGILRHLHPRLWASSNTRGPRRAGWAEAAPGTPCAGQLLLTIHDGLVVVAVDVDISSFNFHILYKVPSLKKAGVTKLLTVMLKIGLHMYQVKNKCVKENYFKCWTKPSGNVAQYFGYTLLCAQIFCQINFEAD